MCNFSYFFSNVALMLSYLVPPSGLPLEYLSVNTEVFFLGGGEFNVTPTPYSKSNKYDPPLSVFLLLVNDVNGPTGTRENLC